MKLSDYSAFLPGLTYAPTDVKNDGLLVLRSSNIQNGQLSFLDNVYVDTEIVPNRIRTKEKDVLMCVRNGSKALVGKTALITSEYADLAWGAFMTVLRPKRHNTFLFQYLNSSSFKTQVFPDLDTATVKQITMGTLNGVHIYVPSLPEQEKIAFFLQWIDARIEKQHNLIETLKKYKRGLLSTIFSKVTTFVHLKDICEYASSAKTMSQIDNTPKGAYPVYDAGGVAAFVDFYDMDTNYIAIIKDGSGVGRLQFCQAESSFIGTLGGLIPKNCSAFYLYTALQTIDFKEYVTGMAIPHIYYKDYKYAMLPYPCEKDRAKIQVIFQNLDCKITNAEMLLEKFNEMKKSLLQQLFI